MIKTLLAQINLEEIAPTVFPPDSIAGQINLPLASLISKFLPYFFAFAGITLFIFLILGGLELLKSGGNPEEIKEGQGKITNALIGFLIIFISYWLIQILEAILGITILG